MVSNVKAHYISPTNPNETKDILLYTSTDDFLGSGKALTTSTGEALYACTSQDATHPKATTVKVSRNGTTLHLCSEAIPNSYTLTIVQPDNGSIKVNGQVVTVYIAHYNESITIEAVANSGYQVDSLNIPEMVANPYTFNALTNLTITAAISALPIPTGSQYFDAETLSFTVPQGVNVLKCTIDAYNNKYIRVTAGKTYNLNTEDSGDFTGDCTEYARVIANALTHKMWYSWFSSRDGVEDSFYQALPFTLSWSPAINAITPTVIDL